MRAELLPHTISYINDEILINSIYNDSYLKQHLEQDGTVLEYFENEAVKHIGVYVGEELAGVFSVIEMPVDCEVHMALKKEYAIYSRSFAMMVMDLLFESGFNRISTSVNDYARPVVNMLLKLGFKYEGKKRQAFIKNGILYDVHMLGMLKEESKL